MSNPLLLDTHAWVWLMLGDRQLGKQARTRLEQAAARTALQVSVLSVWEVAMLESRGRLVLKIDCDTWIQDALRAPGLALANLTPHIAVCSTRLPGAFHGDLADRLIVATARETNSALVTADSAILGYAAAGYVQAVDARR